METRFLKNWLTLLVLVAFIRLQFVCCCGSIDHGILESQPSTFSEAACCPTVVKHGCGCKHHETNQNIAKQTETKSACRCTLCNQDHSHTPHLATEHLRAVPSPNVNYASLVVQQAMPAVPVASADHRSSRTFWLSEKSLHCGISILCQFGHLRI